MLENKVLDLVHDKVLLMPEIQSVETSHDG